MRAGPARSAPPSGFTSTMAPEGSGVKEFPLLWGESATDAAGNVTMMATITFPQEMAGSIIGKGGQNVRQIQITSGAKVGVDLLRKTFAGCMSWLNSLPVRDF